LQLKKKAHERSRDLERPAIDAITRMLEPSSRKNLYAAALGAGTVLRAMNSVLDRVEKLNSCNKSPSDTLIDVGKVVPAALDHDCGDEVERKYA
jgi:hypothetical protein